MLHRTFAAAVSEADGEQPSFTFRGHEFQCVPVGEVPAGVMLDMVAASQQRRRGPGGGNTAELVAGLMAFIMSCLTEDSAAVFDELTHRPWTVKPLTGDDDPTPGWTIQDHPSGERRQVWRTVRDTELEALADWLAEVYIGVPTQPSNASSAASSAAGPSSREAFSSAASPPNTSAPLEPYARVRDLAAEAQAARAGVSSTGQPEPSSTSR